jgi:hypothetical protein
MSRNLFRFADRAKIDGERMTGQEANERYVRESSLRSSRGW